MSENEREREESVLFRSDEEEKKERRNLDPIINSVFDRREREKKSSSVQSL